MRQVFVSYSSKDIDFVEPLVRDIETRVGTSIGVFYDKRVLPGDSWASSLHNALAEAEVIIPVLTPNYLESPWAEKEKQIAVFRVASGEPCRVIPIIARPCIVPADLAAFTWVDFTANYSSAIDKLVWGITGERPAAAVGPTPGQAEKIDPEELRRLRDELREVVEAFKAPDTRIDADALREGIPSRNRRKCFIVMPFADPGLQVVYEDFVKPVLEADGDLVCERGDDVFGSNVIMDDILASIRAADVVLADLTGKNANVFYEVGICHAVGKPVLLLAQSIDDVPFDLRHRRVLLYDYTPRGCKKLERVLKGNLFAVLNA